jgi:S-formylglutathione hydrolase FrmB
MGGFGALRYALVYPELFAAACILSPAIYDREPPEDSSARTTGAFGLPFDPEKWNALNFTSALKDYLKKKTWVPMYISAGDDEWNNEEGFKYNVEYQVVLLYEKLHKVGGSPAELRIVNGDHNWQTWLKILDTGFEYMLNFMDTYPIDSSLEESN